MKNKEILKTQWKEYPLGDIWDILRQVPAFNMAFNDIDQYQAESRISLKRLIKRLDLTFRNNLFDMAVFNVERWVKYLDSFIGFEQVSIKTKPLITLTMSFRELKKKKKSDSSEQLIYFEPNLEEIQQKFTEPITWTIDFLNSLQTLESDFVKILGLPNEQVFSLDKDFKPFDTMANRLTQMAVDAMRAANQIQEDFSQFQFLLENSSEEIIRQYSEIVKRTKSLDQINENLQKIDSSIVELNSLHCNEIHTPLFLINSGPLKEFLYQKAKSIKEGFLKKVSEIVIESIQQINDRFSEMEAALKHVPETEQELIQLQNDIKNCDDNLDRLEADIEMTYKYMLLMEQHGHKFPANHMYKFWLLKISPLEIKRIFGDSQRTLVQREQYFIKTLEDEKKVFESQLQQYRNEFEQLKLFSQYNRVTEHAKFSEELGTKIDQAKERRVNFNEREQMFELSQSNYEQLD